MARHQVVIVRFRDGKPASVNACAVARRVSFVSGQSGIMVVTSSKGACAARR